MGRRPAPWRRDPAKYRDRGLIPFGWALGGTFALAIGLTVAGVWLGLRLLGFRHFQAEPELSFSTFYDLLKLVFGVVAGIGGVIALVVSYRKQRIAESAEAREVAKTADERTRVFNERFITAAQQLGSDSSAVRLAGVYAMAGLGDDWDEQRQTCIDVLCAYLRIPIVPQPPETDVAELASWRGFREVRNTIVRVIAAHLRPEARVSWQGQDFDFTEVVFDGLHNFDKAQFIGGTVSFNQARFTGGTVNFNKAQFDGGTVTFNKAQFDGGTVTFNWTKFTSGTVTFNGAHFTGGTVTFLLAEFIGGVVSFLTDVWRVPPLFPWWVSGSPPDFVRLPSSPSGQASTSV